MPKQSVLSAKAVKDFSQGKGSYKGNLLNVSKNLYIKRTTNQKSGGFNCF